MNYLDNDVSAGNPKTSNPTGSKVVNLALQGGGRLGNAGWRRDLSMSYINVKDSDRANLKSEREHTAETPHRGVASPPAATLTP
jgi:hypothetical protein